MAVRRWGVGGVGLGGVGGLAGVDGGVWEGWTAVRTSSRRFGLRPRSSTAKAVDERRVRVPSGPRNVSGPSSCGRVGPSATLHPPGRRGTPTPPPWTS